MEKSFEEVLHLYTPMIQHIIKTLNIYKNKEYYFQEGSIALWEAESSFQPEKGAFSSYAYSTIRGKLLNLLKKEAKWESLHCTLEDGQIEAVYEQETPLFKNIVGYTQNLTENQKKWLVEFIYNEKKIEEIALQEGVSASAVKSWRRGAIKNLKKQMQLSLQK